MVDMRLSRRQIVIVVVVLVIAVSVILGSPLFTSHGSSSITFGPR
jgi:hypothetical protein